jgi:NADH-quinone oxidoreductase subunit N
MVALLTLGASAYSVFRVRDIRRTLFEGMFLHDGFTVFFTLMFCAVAAVAVLQSWDYVRRTRINHGEYYALILAATLGMILMAASNDLITVFLGLELMSLALYVLVGFRRGRLDSSEAALKYFLLGAFASGFLLYGIALLYGATGTTHLGRMAAFLGDTPLLGNPLLMMGGLLVLVGFGFKVAAVPFHMWAPDAYEGAPTPVTAYLAVGSKAASFAFLLRLFTGPLWTLKEVWEPLLGIIAVATLTLGNLAAITQSNIKRLLAYSSISHAGFILLGLVAGNPTGIKGVAVYVMVYAFMTLGAFLVVVALRRENLLGEDLEDLGGLMKKSPAHALLMLVFMVSLAGIPPTAGFLGKYYIFLSLIETRHYVLAVIGTLYAAVAVYYYFRVVRSMFAGEEVDQEPVASSYGLRLALGVTGVLTLLIGVWPEPFLRLAQTSLMR